MTNQTYLRTPEMNEKLSKHTAQGCLFCNAGGGDVFTYWAIRKNDFPYDAIATKHDMIYLKRHSKFPNEEEEIELKTILRTIRQFGEYEALLQSLDEKASIPNHYHLHLFKFKRT